MDLGHTMLHPAILMLMQYSVPTLVFALVPPSSLRVRLLALVPMVCLQAHVTLTARFYVRPSYAAIAAGQASFMVLHFIDVGLLRRYECANLTWKYDANDKSLMHRLYRGWLLTCNLRKIDTPLETKNVPRFPGDTAPERRAFLGSNARMTLTCFLVADILLTLGTLSESPSILPRPDAPPMERLKKAVPIVLGQWASVYALIQGTHSLAAFMAVALGISEPRAWRPILGSFADLFTLRALWGSSWHQLGRDLWSRPASFIVHDLLRFPRQSVWLAMHLKMAIVFALSGAVHLVCDVAMGVAWRDSRAMHFFMLQAFGIMLESYVSLLLGHKHVTEKPTDWSVPQKILGYVWVFFWMFWTGSLWVLPMLEAVQRQRLGFASRSFLPFSVLQPASKLLLRRLV